MSAQEQPQLYRWEVLEEWLNDNDEEPLTCQSLAAAMDITNGEASELICAYLSAQRGKNPRTLYVLHREGRTTNAVWTIGHRMADVRALNHTLYEDIVAKVERAWKKDLDRIKELNPRAAAEVNRRIEAVLNGALVMLAVAVNETKAAAEEDANEE